MKPFGSYVIKRTVMIRWSNFLFQPLFSARSLYFSVSSDLNWMGAKFIYCLSILTLCYYFHWYRIQWVRFQSQKWGKIKSFAIQFKNHRQNWHTAQDNLLRFNVKSAFAPITNKIKRGRIFWAVDHQINATFVWLYCVLCFCFILNNFLGCLNVTKMVCACV